MTAERVICWRHGRTGYNHGGIWQGQLDIPLDEVGRRQASAAAEALAARLAGEPATLVSSDLVRASETAGRLAARLELPVVLDRRLREIDAGRWQGLTRAEIALSGMQEELAAWQRGEDVRIGGGERRSEASLRCAAAIVEHAAATPAGTLVVVAHGGVLRGAALTLLGLPPDRWQLLGVLGNAHWAELIPPAHWPEAPVPAPANAGPAPTPGGPALAAGPAPAPAPSPGPAPVPGSAGPAQLWRLQAYNLTATPSGDRFEVPPPARGRLTEPRR